MFVLDSWTSLVSRSNLRLGIPGEDFPGAEDGMGFQRRMVTEDPVPLEGDVAVIGGGNSAVDVARTVARLGARPIILYRRRCQDMPAFPEEVEMALEEGAQLLELRSPVRIDRDGNGMVLALQEMLVMGEDDNGRARIEAHPGRVERISVSRVFVAVGQEAEEDWMNPGKSDGTLSVFDNTALMMTERGFPVIRGGDLTNDVKNITRAIASGKEGAMALDVCSFAAALRTSGPDWPSARSATAAPFPWRSTGAGRGPSAAAMWSGTRRSTWTTSGSCRASLSRGSSRPRGCGPFPRSTSGFPQPLPCGRRTVVSTAASATSATTAACSAPIWPWLSSRAINYDYCKGCGVCVVECPRNAMSLTPEKDAQGA